MNTCPYCQSNLRPERASVITGDVEGGKSGLGLVPREQGVGEESGPLDEKRTKRTVKLGTTAAQDWAEGRNAPPKRRAPAKRKAAARG